jgi:putative hemolysin
MAKSICAIVAVGAVALAACVSSSEVQPIGNGRYMITGRASGGLNAGKETTEATKAANAYCAKQGKQMVLQNLDKAGNAAVFGENVSLTFTCEPI